MATIKAQNNQRNAANTAWDVIHHETEASVVLMDDGATKLSDRLKIQTAAGTATAITLTGVELVNGFQLTFVVLSSNSGAATTINSKPLYKPGTTTAPKLIAGKAATVWYNTAGGCFFIKASAEGTAVAGDVLAGKTFSNDDDTGITGTYSNIKSIQTGVTTWGTDGTKDITIASITKNNSIAFINFLPYANANNVMVGIQILNSTTIRLNRNFGISGTSPLRWTVIEFNNVKTRQEGIASITTSSDTTGTTVTINNVDVSKSILFVTQITSNSLYDKILLSYNIKTSTSIELFCKSANTDYAYWQLIEFN